MAPPSPARRGLPRLPGVLPAGWPAVLLMGTLLMALVAAGCSSPAPRKRSFMASAEGVRAPADEPVGLNPLGSLDTCRIGEGEPGSEWQPGTPARVLVSRPEAFTREASQMIQALREALAQPTAGLPPVAFLLTPQPITNEAQARSMGRGCHALIVLWEPRRTKTLELTLPDPTRVPLRDLVQTQLCEFGNHQEQLRILYLTIAGLVSLRDNEYDRAVLYMDTARAIDNRCLHLPGADAPETGAGPDAPGSDR